MFLSNCNYSYNITTIVVVVKHKNVVWYTTIMTVKVNEKTQQLIGKNLRNRREQKDLLQEDIAKAVGISNTYYAGIERGEENPTIAVIESICKVLKIKSSDILPF